MCCCYAPTRGHGFVFGYMFVVKSGTPMRTSMPSVCAHAEKNASMLQWPTVKSKYKHIRHLPKNEVAEAFGWLGSFMLLGGYALLSLGIVDSTSLVYHGMSMIGGAGLAVVTYRHRAFQSVMVNVFFTLLAIMTIVRLTFFA